MASGSRGGYSNLQSFVNATTPSVPTRTLPKWSFQGWSNLWFPAGSDAVESFELVDLWDQYREWSAYGAGAEVLLHDGEIVDQYYVPYLSAIQIYTCKSRASSRNGVSNCWNNGIAYKKLVVDPRGVCAAAQEEEEEEEEEEEDTGFDHHQGTRRAREEEFGHLYFQFTETDSPYGRPPLSEKVRELASVYPGLMSFNSAELSPASWMSVAWYPIYHIPSRPIMKDLTACFLTYHRLASSCPDHMQGNAATSVPYTIGGGKSRSEFEEKGNHRITLHPFGLATYRAQGNIWINPEGGDDERIVSLYNAADSWLKQLNVYHSDFKFFTSH